MISVLPEYLATVQHGGVAFWDTLRAFQPPSFVDSPNTCGIHTFCFALSANHANHSLNIVLIKRGRY